MTPYQVIWSRDALRQLAALWNASRPMRNDIMRAQYRIDVELARDPKSAGRELSEGLWRIDEPPLIAFYEINDFHKILRVTDVYVC